MVEQTQDTDQTKRQVHEAIEKLGEEIPPEAMSLIEKAALQVALGLAEPKDALGLTPDMMEAIYQQGYNFFQTGKYRDALTIFNALRYLDILDGRYTFAIAACYHHLKDYTNAAANYLIYRQMDPLNPEASFHLYDCFFKTQNPTASLFYIQEALVLAGMDPKYADFKEKIKLETEHLNQYLEKYYKEKYGSAA